MTAPSLDRTLRPLAGPEVHRLVTTAAHAIGGLGQFEAVIASGGLVSGFSHAYSDLDLYCLRRPNLPPPARRIVAVDDVEVQFNLVERGDVEDAATCFAKLTYTRHDRDQMQAYRRHQKLVSRLVTGLQIHADQPAADLLSRIDSSVYRRLGIIWHSIQVSRMLEDACGAVRAADPLIALQATGNALLSAVECVLLGVGDLHVGDALLFRRAASHPALGTVMASVLPAQASLLETLAAGPADGFEGRVREACRLASVLASTATVDGWDRVLARVVLDPGSLTESISRVRTSPFHVVLRLGMSFSIAGPDAGLRTNEQTARAWLATNSGNLPGSLLSLLSAKGLVTRCRSDVR